MSQFFMQRQTWLDSFTVKGSFLANKQAFADPLRAAQLPHRQTWLESTARLLSNANQKAFQAANDALADVMVRDISAIFDGALSVRLGDNARMDLRKICATAMEHFRLLLRQSARFSLDMIDIQPDTTFDPTTMEVFTGGGEDQSVTGRPLELSIFPNIIKSGDEMGSQVCHGLILSLATS